MVFWIAVAVLAAAVTYAVTRPLASALNPITQGPESGQAVYKDQLKEIDADRARGLLSESEAEAARAEVARRLIRDADTLAASKAKATGVAPASSHSMKRVFLLASMAIPLVSLGLYLHLGAPGLPGQPYSARLAAPVDTAQAGDLIAKVEARLREHPEDGKGWDVIAPIYMAAGRFDEAANAYESAARILGTTAARLEGFALARISAGNGLVSDDARKALARALELDPKRHESRIWLALAKEQDGNISGALADFKALLSTAPQDAPWRKAVEARIAGLDGKANGSAPAATAPPRADAAAIAAMPQDERDRMIATMVDSLANRLKANGNDLTGWLKLVRAYKVMGREGDARTALANAQKQFSGDSKSLTDLDALANDLKLGP